MLASQPTQRADGQVDNRQHFGGYPLVHSPYDDGCGQRLLCYPSTSAAPLARPHNGQDEPTPDEVGSFSMMTVSAVYPPVGRNSMMKWAPICMMINTKRMRIRKWAAACGSA